MPFVRSDPHETRTKIVCTIGPASGDLETLQTLIAEGMDVARINFSHGTREEHAQTIASVRQAAADQHATVAVLADLQGPKIRIGELARSLALEAGAWLALTTRPADGEHHVVTLPHPDMIKDVHPGARILFGDGEIEGTVREVRPHTLIVEVETEGTLRSRQGVVVPDAPAPIAALTEKDEEDARFAVSCDVDFVALSFVQSPDDVEALRSLLDDAGGEDVAIVAKIERRSALDQFDGILDVTDAVMIARGDLGIEVPPQEVPIHQKRMIRACRGAGVPVITATQMLQSMTENPRPTRAEASDVANAILDGTDAVMLSAETAIGRYPVRTVAMMREISAIAEAHMPYGSQTVRASDEDHRVTDAISDATVRIADDVGGALIATSTTSGYTARQVARERPRQSIVALTTDERVLRQLALVWGVVPLPVASFDGADEMLQVVSRALSEGGYAEQGDLVVVTAGLPTGGRGTTNLIKVHRI